MSKRGCVLFAAFVLVQSASAEVICQRRGGALVVREKCKRSERAADLSTLGALGPAGEPAVGARLVDATGKQVGSAVALEFDRQSAVALSATGYVLFAAVTRNGFVEVPVKVLHESSDCSGTAFAQFQGYRTTRIVTLDGSIAYFAGDPIETHSFMSAEARVDPTTCTTGFGGTILPNGFCCTHSTVTGDAGPVTTFDLATLGVTPPFHLEITR